MNEGFFRLHRRLIFLNIFSLCVFIALAVFVIFSPSLTKVDLWALGIYSLAVSETITSLMEVLSFLFHPGLIMIVSVLAFSFLAALGRRVIAGVFLASLLCAISSSLILKDILEITRPIGDPSEWGFGFPSTHATAVAVFLLSILFALDKKLKDRAVHFLALFVVFVLIFATGVSRVYLGYHFATDVIAGFALGTFWFTLAFLVFYKIRELSPWLKGAVRKSDTIRHTKSNN